MSNTPPDLVDMEGVGQSIGETSKKNLAAKRLKKGECPTCGNRTHKVGFFGKRTALTIEGQCLFGRCLICNPVDGPFRPGEGGNNYVPRTIETEAHLPDDSTMVSGITMDHRLIIGARTYNEGMVEGEDDSEEDEGYHSDDMMDPGIGRVSRPEPSLGGDLAMPPTRPVGRSSLYPGGRGDVSPPPGPPMRGHDITIGGRPSGAPENRHPHYMDENPGAAPHGGAAAAADNRMHSFPPEFNVGERPPPGESNWPVGPVGIPPQIHSRRSQVEYTRTGQPRDLGPNNDTAFHPPSRLSAARGMENSDAQFDDMRFPPGASRDVKFSPHHMPTGGGGAGAGGGGGGAGLPLEIVRKKSNNVTAPAGVEFRPNEEVSNHAPENSELPMNVSIRRPDDRDATAQSQGVMGDRKPQMDFPSGDDMHFNDRRTDENLFHESPPERVRFQQANPRLDGPVDLDFTPPPTESHMHSRDFRAESQAPSSFPSRVNRGSMEADGGKIGPDQNPSSNITMPIPQMGPSSSMQSKVSATQPSNRPSPRQAPASNIVPIASTAVASAPSDRAEMPSQGSFRSLNQSDQSAVSQSMQSRARRPTSRSLPKKNHEHISVILNNMDDSGKREKSFLELAQIILDCGQKGKVRFKEFYGMDVLVESMWDDMGNASMQAAACELFLALAASRDGKPTSDVLVGSTAEGGAVEALLFIMQTHCNVESIQKSGCATFCCLAAASSNNTEINDGTLSGAIQSVVTALGNHPNSVVVQELGLRALFSQCVLSANAESNKSTLASMEVEGIGKGINVLPRAMNKAFADISIMEYACRLYWCLTSSEEVASLLSSTRDHLTAIANTVRQFHGGTNSAPLMEAAFGSLANLARLEQNHAPISEEGLAGTAVDALQHYSDREGVLIEACSLLANLAQTPALKAEIIEIDGVGTICRTLQEQGSNTEFQEEALAALGSLAVESSIAKSVLANEATMSFLLQILRDKRAPVTVHEKICSLLASLSVDQKSAELAVDVGVVNNLISVMRLRAGDRKTSEAVLLALRNIATHGHALDVLLDETLVGEFIGIMENHSDSEMIQITGCSLLWIISSKAPKESERVVKAGGIEQAVKSMQSHMESSSVLQMACGALWTLIDQSEDRKQKIVRSGGIDAVTCALVMHPEAPSTLAMACGVLSSLCVKSKTAEAVADSQGIGMVVEAMRTNNSSVPLLKLGILVLRNITLMNPKYASEASNGISTIVSAMKSFPEIVELQEEACYTLWAMASQSEDCKAKILALDGVGILMEALDRHSGDGVVDAAARGAISQLALPA